MGKEQSADDPGVRALAWAQGRLLEALVGWWVDDTASSYEVHLDLNGDTCSVRIWRRGGANYLRKAVIRQLADKKGRPSGVTWNRSYSLDLDIAPIETVTWLSHKKAKPFVWRRWCDMVSQGELKLAGEAVTESTKGINRRVAAHEDWAEEADWWNQSWWQDDSWAEEEEWGEEEPAHGKKKKKEVNGSKTVWRERVKKEEGSFDVMALFEKAAAKSKAAQKEAANNQPTATSISPSVAAANKPAADIITELLQPKGASAPPASTGSTSAGGAQTASQQAGALTALAASTDAAQQATQHAQHAAQQAFARQAAHAAQIAVAQQAAAAQHAAAQQAAQAQQVQAQGGMQTPSSAAAAAANAVTAANSVAPAHMLAQSPLQPTGDYRQYYRCANPDCWFMVNPDPIFGSRCAQQVAHQSLPRAPPEEPVQRSPLFEKGDCDLDGDEVEDGQATGNNQYSSAAAAAAAAASMAPPGDWSAWNVSQTVGRDAYGRPCVVPPYAHSMWSQTQYTHYHHAAAAAAFASALYNPAAAATPAQRPAALPLSSPPELPAQELQMDTSVPASVVRVQPRRGGGGRRKQKV